MATRDLLQRLYRQLFTIRVFETRCIQLYRSGAIRGYFHPYLGEEAIAVGVCAALRPQDYVLSTHRGHGHCIARGAALDRMMAELLGRATGFCRGRGGSMHIADAATGTLGANGIVGGGIPMGVGAALGAKLRGEDRVAAVFFSDGAAGNGVFPESLNLAALWDLGVLFVIENNHYAVSTPVEQSAREPRLHLRAAGYGVDGHQVDGNDALAVLKAAEAAVARCVAGRGPVVLECDTWRHQGHHVNDPGDYMPKDRTAYFKNQHDPVSIGRARLREVAEEAEVCAIEEAVRGEIEGAVAFAMASPQPDVEEFLAEAGRTYG